MDIDALLRTLREAYGSDRAGVSGLKTVHQKTSVSASLAADFDSALERAEEDGDEEEREKRRKARKVYAAR